MKYFRFFFVLCIGIIFLGKSLTVSAEEFSISSANSKINSLLEAESKITLSVATSIPNKRITELMKQIDIVGQEIMDQEPTDEILALSEKCLAIMTVLRERRIYAYMLWAEGLLEQSKTGSYAKLSSLNQNTLMALYCRLSEVNISIVRENMLSREIMSRLAEIYDCLSAENKQTVRIKAIQMQRDSLSIIENVPLRKTVDDF